MNKSRTKKSLINISTNILNQIISILVNFILRNIFIHTLGVEILGINGLFSDVLSMLSMADLGFSTAMTFSFYKPIADHNEEKIAALITFYKRVYTIISIVISVIGVGIIPFLPYIIHTEKEIPYLIPYYLLSLCSVVISYLFVYKTSIIVADQKEYIISSITMIVTLIRSVVQIFSLLLFRSYIVYLSIGVIANFFNNFIASRKAVKLYPYINHDVKLPTIEIKEIFDNLKSIFIYKLSSVLLTATDNILISILVSTAMVGIYSNYLMIVNKVTTIFSLIFTSLTASIGNLIVTEKAQKRYQVFESEQVVSFMICGIVVPCLGTLINEFIALWIGEQYILNCQVVIVISINLYLACVLQPLWSYRGATGLYLQTKWIMALAAIVNLVFSIVLGKIYGLLGILAASAIARISTYVWYEPQILFKKYFEQPSGSYFISIIKNVIVTACVYWGLFILNNQWTVKNWLGLIIKGVIYSLICLCVMVVYYHNSEGIKLLKNRFLLGFNSKKIRS